METHQNLRSYSEEEKTTEGVVVHAIIIDYPVCLELHIHIVSHLEGDDHSVAAHVVGIRPVSVPDRCQPYTVLHEAHNRAGNRIEVVEHGESKEVHSFDH